MSLPITTVMPCNNADPDDDNDGMKTRMSLQLAQIL